MTEPTSRSRIQSQSRSSEFWIPVGLGALIGAVFGWQIRSLFSQPGMEALEGAVLALFVGGAVAVVAFVGIVLLALHRRSAGRIVLMAAAACALAAVIVAAIASLFPGT